MPGFGSELDAARFGDDAVGLGTAGFESELGSELGAGLWLGSGLWLGPGLWLGSGLGAGVSAAVLVTVTEVAF